jgi:hypothetical protein
VKWEILGAKNDIPKEMPFAEWTTNSKESAPLDGTNLQTIDIILKI